MQRLRTTLVLLTAVFLALPTIGTTQESPPRIAVETVREEAVEEVVRLTGTVTAARAANLSPATSGLVTSLRVDAGSRVTSGELLLELDPELARYQAEGSEAAVRAARVALEDARRRLQEARALAPQQSIAETLVRDLAAEVAGDEAALQQAEADAGYRRALLARHQLRAPFDGVIATKLSEVGEWVVPGDTVLELVATGELWIDFPVAEDYLNRLGPGSSVTFTTGAGEQRPHEGTVATVVPVSDPGVRTFLLRVDPGGPIDGLSPGMSVRGRIHLQAGRRAPVVSRDAIIRYPDGRVIVWAVEAGDDGLLVRERLIETGLMFDGLVEVRAGLEPGVRVVVKGNEALRAGQPVTVLDEGVD